jgi:hypothetical protein
MEEQQGLVAVARDLGRCRGCRDSKVIAKSISWFNLEDSVDGDGDSVEPTTSNEERADDAGPGT